MDFIWDENKNQLNIKKHNISFEQAIFIFDDIFRQEFYDIEHSIDEDRYIIIGNANNNILVVIETEIEQDVIRIISARKALKREKEVYYEHCKTYKGFSS